MKTTKPNSISCPSTTFKRRRLRQFGVGVALMAASVGVAPAVGAAEATPAPLAAATSCTIKPSSNYDLSVWSREHAQIWRLYAAYFQRQPDFAGLNYWTNQLRAGTSLSAVSGVFAGSTEFRNMYGNLSNRDFVSRIYQNVLCRSADSGGLNYWTGLLDQGRMSRGQVMTAFSESVEFKVKTGTTGF